MGTNMVAAGQASALDLEQLASAAPVPGGGGASACCGAIASALCSMVAHLTVGKKRYAEVEPQMYEHLAALEEVRTELLALITQDAEAFEPLANAYKMPHATEEEARTRSEAIQQALVQATEVPLAIMQACARVLDLSEFLVYHGSRMAASDAAAGITIAKAALEAASLNVYINTASMANKAAAARYNAKADGLIEEYSARATTLYAYVLEEIR